MVHLLDIILSIGVHLPRLSEFSSQDLDLTLFVSHQVLQLVHLVHLVRELLHDFVRLFQIVATLHGFDLVLPPFEICME